MNLREAQQFVAQFNSEEYTREEHAVFLRWLEGTTADELAAVADVHESMQAEWELPEGPSAEWIDQLERKLDESEEKGTGETVMDDRGSPDKQPAVVLAMRRFRKRWWSVGVSAAAVVVLITGTYIYRQRMGSKEGNTADREKLLSMAIVNPRGGAQKEMVLPDGSKVWLDAGSVLRYPPEFRGRERLVDLSGEAFFDVSGAPGSPFRVRIKDAEVEVLGTFFTVMAYDDEPENRTAVVNGAVKVTSRERSVTVKPGEQAEVVYASPDAPVVSPINTNDILLYKNGIYKFQSTELSVIMREIARAYDVTVEVGPGIGNQKIGGSLDLNKSLEITLERLNAVTMSFNVQINRKEKTVIASSI